VRGDTGWDTAATIPLDTLKELLTDHILMLNVHAYSSGEGNAQEVLLRRVQDREAEDAARTAWLRNEG